MTSKLKLICALTSGVLLTAAFPPLKLEWVAGFALVPLLKAIDGEPPKSAFIWGFVAGMAHFLSLIYWIIFVMAHYGGLHSAISVGILILFCLYLGSLDFFIRCQFFRGRRLVSD